MYCTEVSGRIVRVPGLCKSPEDATVVLVQAEGKCGDRQNHCQCQSYSKRYEAVTWSWKKMKKKESFNDNKDRYCPIIAFYLFLRKYKWFLLFPIYLFLDAPLPREYLKSNTKKIVRWAFFLQVSKIKSLLMVVLSKWWPMIKLGLLFFYK